MLNDKVIMITGGTGSFGNQCVRTILRRYLPKKIIIFSRDELKKFEMSKSFSVQQYPRMRYFLGDVRYSRSGPMQETKGDINRPDATVKQYMSDQMGAVEFYGANKPGISIM